MDSLVKTTIFFTIDAIIEFASDISTLGGSRAVSPPHLYSMCVAFKQIVEKRLNKSSLQGFVSLLDIQSLQIVNRIVMRLIAAVKKCEMRKKEGRYFVWPNPP